MPNTEDHAVTTQDTTQILIDNGDTIYDIRKIIADNQDLSLDNVTLADIEKWMRGDNPPPEITPISSQNNQAKLWILTQSHEEVTADELRQYLNNVRDDATISYVMTERGNNELISYIKSQKHRAKTDSLSSDTSTDETDSDRTVFGNIEENAGQQSDTDSFFSGFSETTGTGSVGRNQEDDNFLNDSHSDTSSGNISSTHDNSVFSENDISSIDDLSQTQDINDDIMPAAEATTATDESATRAVFDMSIGSAAIGGSATAATATTHANAAVTIPTQATLLLVGISTAIGGALDQQRQNENKPIHNNHNNHNDPDHHHANRDPIGWKNSPQQQNNIEENLNPQTNPIHIQKRTTNEQNPMQNDPSRHENIRHYTQSEHDNDADHAPLPHMPSKTEDIVWEIAQPRTHHCPEPHNMPPISVHTLHQDYSAILQPNALWAHHGLNHATHYLSQLRQSEECRSHDNPSLDNPDKIQTLTQAQDYAKNILSIGALYIALEQPETYSIPEHAGSKIKPIITHMLFDTQLPQTAHDALETLQNIAGDAEYIYVRSQENQTKSGENHDPYAFSVDVINNAKNIIEHIKTIENYNINALHSYIPEICDDIFST